MNGAFMELLRTAEGAWRSLKVDVCVAYGEFLIFLRPLMERMPGWVQGRYVEDMDEAAEYISRGER